MGKTFDKLGVALIVALLSFLFFFRVTHSLPMGAISAILFVAVIFLFIRLIKPKSPKNLLTKRNFIRYVLLKGSFALKSLVENSFPEGTATQTIGDHTLLFKDGQRILIYYAYKFGSLSEEDVAKSYRLAENAHCEEIYALTNHLDRKALAVAEYIPQRFTVVSAGALYKYLCKKGMMPEKEALPKKNNRKFAFLKTAIKRDNARYYVWAGLTTALLALFTPITIYYIVFSFLNLALALACILYGEAGEGKDRLFKE